MDFGNPVAVEMSDEEIAELEEWLISQSIQSMSDIIAEVEQEIFSDGGI